ncbi:hybrid sensory histidine kinase BarA [compost metagenome]
MPEMDGYELISMVRKSPHPHQKEVLAVALTAFARDEEEEKSLSAGFDAHLSKPIAAHDLVERLATLLHS